MNKTTTLSTTPDYGETCQTCHSLCPPAVVESGECIWCIAEQFKRENAAMRDAIKEAHEAFKRTEFIEDVNGLYCCPGCLNYEQNGHKPNCDYVAALAKLQPFLKP